MGRTENGGMNRADVNIRMRSLSRRAITDVEHAVLTAVKGSPLTWQRPPAHICGHAPDRPDAERRLAARGVLGDHDSARTPDR